MYKVNMPSTDSFSDSRYGQSQEYDHELDDHDTGYNSYLNTGMNFGNLSTGNLIQVLKNIQNPDETVQKLIEQHSRLVESDFKEKTAAYYDFVKPAKTYVKAHTKKAAKQPSLHDIIDELSRTHTVLNDFLNLHDYEKYKIQKETRKWNQLAKQFCKEKKILLPPKPKNLSTKSNLKHFIVREHNSQNGKYYLTIIPKHPHEHHHDKKDSKS
jgi:hypothetical protein